MTTSSQNPVRLSDERCRRLWSLNDAECLAVVAERFPDILPPDEWQQIRTHHAAIFDGPATFEQHVMWDVPGRHWTPALIEKEWYEQAYGSRMLALMRFFLDRWSWHEGFAPRQVLDVGSWTGTYTIALSNRFPQAQVHAREPHRQVVQGFWLAVKRFALFPQNISLSQGTHARPPLPTGNDLTFAGEVLEHVPDLHEFVRVLENATLPGGKILLTTPIEYSEDASQAREDLRCLACNIILLDQEPACPVCGGPPTPYLSYTHEHVRHLEADDLIELFGQKRHVYIGDAGRWHLISWTRGDEPTGTINWDRKLRKWGFPA